MFPTTGQDNWNTLYVEFGSEYQVDKVFKHTKYMAKRDHRVIHWFPRQMKERREAVEKIAYDIRVAGTTSKVRTRVRVGREDLELCTKLPGGKWQRELLPPDLPAIDLLYSSEPVQSLSPPPGRPGIDDLITRKRQKSPDSEAEDITKKYKHGTPPKVGNKVGDMVEDMVGDKVENKVENNVGKDQEEHSKGISGKDRGKFTGLEAYSPLTPAKTKVIPDISVILNSPVFHSKSSKK